MCKIFVSYAHIDDDPLLGADMGWVSTVVASLRKLIPRYTGRRDFEFWFDNRNLRGNHAVEAEIVRTLGNCDMLLVLLSKAYLASQWCMGEQEAFHDAHSSDIQGRVFILEMMPIGDEERDRLATPGLKHYKFWRYDENGVPRTFAMPVPDTSERVYFQNLQDVAQDIAENIEAFENTKLGARHASPESAKAPLVTLAEVTDDLHEAREEICRRLQDARIAFEALDSYGQTTEQFTARIDTFLSRSRLFVQLLGATSSKPRPGAPGGFARLQFDRAVAAKIRAMLWRHPDISFAAIADQSHRSLLDHEAVDASPFEVFKESVLSAARLLSQKIEREPKLQTSPFVFVNANARDRNLARSLCDNLPDHVPWAMPIEQGEPDEIRRELAEFIVECDRLVLLYGASGPIWVSQQLRFVNKLTHKRERPLRDIILFDAPPKEKPTISMHIPGMRVVDCRDGFEPREFAKMLA